MSNKEPWKNFCAFKSLDFQKVLSHLPMGKVCRALEYLLSKKTKEGNVAEHLPERNLNQ